MTRPTHKTADNSRLKRTIEFDVTDALMLAHAMMIASTTAWMCGHPGARERCKKYAAMFAAHVPPAARVFDGDTWAEIGMALATGLSFQVDAESRAGHFDCLIVRVFAAGGTSLRFRSKPLRGDERTRFRDGAHDATIAAVAVVLADIAPIGCIRREQPATSGD